VRIGSAPRDLFSFRCATRNVFCPNFRFFASTRIVEQADQRFFSRPRCLCIDSLCSEYGIYSEYSGWQGFSLSGTWVFDGGLKIGQNGH
jgi:hypothetical protein